VPASQDNDLDSQPASSWYLEGYGQQGQRLSARLHRLPFRIGRLQTSDLRLPAAEVSRLHAEILEHDGELHIRECGSTNGTYVNRQRLYWELPLHSGDVIHFGPLEFRIYHSDYQSEAATVVTPPPLQAAAHYQAQFQEMLRLRSVVAHFQPLLRLRDRQLVGHEVRGHCEFAHLPREPRALLQLARELHKEIELSELLREVGLEQAASLGNWHPLFLNAAPSEVEPLRLAHSLSRLRRLEPALPLVLEVHEAAIADLSTLRNLHAVLSELGIELAFDDFGVGQTRLEELIKLPPHWQQEPKRTWRVLRALVAMARDLGIKTIAEGIETKAQWQICKRLGFDVAQGYYIGRPLPFFGSF
jgi:EAL domain-containing protein (putative c-di-GMP-specific phosphodiesterase class I)